MGKHKITLEKIENKVMIFWYEQLPDIERLGRKIDRAVWVLILFCSVILAVMLLWLP